ncbi:MAG: fatty acid desaturase [Polyangiaceae bacterium]|nr:fatty acid desaturase [Polyangiaceae bacterium]
MKQAQWIDQGIRLGNRFHYRKKNPWRHNALNLSIFSAMLAGIGTTIAAGRHVQHWLYVPIAAAVLGIMFFAMIILVVHEASHDMFVISYDRDRARRWNRRFGWLVSIPFGINYRRHWEEGHHTHHIHPLEPDDPQTANLWTGRRLVREIVLMLVVPGYVLLWNPSRKYKTERWVGPVNVVFWSSLLAALCMHDAWMSAVAIVFGFGVLGALNQIKGSLEHGGPVGFESNRNLRSRTSLFALRHLLMPFNISLHFEHHLNYCVPWYDLGRYHHSLVEATPEPLRAYIYNTRIIDQLMGRVGTFPEDMRHLVVVDRDESARVAHVIGH